MIFMEPDITLGAPGKIISVSKTTFSCAKKIVTFASKIISGVENIVLLTEWIVAATQMIGSKSLRLSVKPLVRQAKLGAFLQGASPSGVRINHPLLPSVATATEEVETPNKSVEAYTGKHAGRRRDRDLQSLIQPRHGV